MIHMLAKHGHRTVEERGGTFLEIEHDEELMVVRVNRSIGSLEIEDALDRLFHGRTFGEVLRGVAADDRSVPFPQSHIKLDRAHSVLQRLVDILELEKILGRGMELDDHLGMFEFGDPSRVCGDRGREEQCADEEDSMHRLVSRRISEATELDPVLVRIA
ncbi:MAG TPA: hypothetical protein VFD83_03650, partial [Candidatus Polarisedimenticolia bacterium]|nr:hypothetical protein [Candidatus Polarisedimenticolia bacterium]